jgi:uncharacterized protein
METPPPFSPEPLPPTPGPSSNPSAHQWKVILHASAFAGLFCPFGSVLGPLIVWLIKKTEIPSLETEGRKVLNFQISFVIYFVVSAILAAALSCLHVPFILPFAVGVTWLVLTIMGTVKTSNGEDYVYPLSIKII